MSFPDSIVTMRHYLPRRGLRVGYDYCWVRCRRQVTSWLDINKYTKIVVNSVSCDLTPRCCDNGVAVIYICSGTGCKKGFSPNENSMEIDCEIFNLPHMTTS